MPSHPTVLALSGGIGGAKLAQGLAHQLAPRELAIVCNTGDDFEHCGLTICPDLDTVMYTLAQRSHPEQGWGLRDESWTVMTALSALGGETWFRIGDLDLATHLYRASKLAAGMGLAEVTRELCSAFGVKHALWPMSEEPVRTIVRTEHGDLPFQHYFVRDQCKPAVKGFNFAGIEIARPLPSMMAALADDDLDAVIVCPSNPFISIDPILSLAGVRSALKISKSPVVAISPIVGGEAIKGPTAKMMRELDLEVTASGVAEYYADFIDGFVIDHADTRQSPTIEALGLTVLVTNTIMRTSDQKIALATDVLQFAAAIKRNSLCGL